MKTLKSLLIIAALGCGFSPHAQQDNDAGSAATNLLSSSKVFKLKQAADNVVMVSAPKMKTPKMVQLDLAAQMQKIKDQCPYLQSEKPTLKLDGERKSHSAVTLEWETTNGWNNREFILERSLGDTFHFETINMVWAKEVAGIKDHYQKPDENSFNKVSYYRVKLLLRNGGSLYSNIAPVKGYEIQGVKLYPNPAFDNVIIAINTETEGGAIICIYDAAGKMVSQQASSVAGGFNNRELNVSQLAAGFYTVKVLMPDKTEKTVRFIKQ